MIKHKRVYQESLSDFLDDIFKFYNPCTFTEKLV